MIRWGWNDSKKRASLQQNAKTAPHARHARPPVRLQTRWSDPLNARTWRLSIFLESDKNSVLNEHFRTLRLLVKVGKDHLARAASFCNHCLSDSMSSPYFSQMLVPYQIQIERSPSILGRFTVAVNVGTMNVCGLGLVHNQAAAFLQQKEHASTGSTHVRVSRAFAFTTSVQHLATNQANSRLFAVW